MSTSTSLPIANTSLTTEKRRQFLQKWSRKVSVDMSSTNDENQLVLNTGATLDIADLAEFEVYKDTNSSTEKPLGTQHAYSFWPSSTTVRASPEGTSFIVTKSFVVIQTQTEGREDIRLYIPEDDRFLSCYQAWVSLMQEKHESVLNISLVDTPQDAHLELAKKNNEVIFLIKDEWLLRRGFNRVYSGVKPTVEELVAIMKSAAHYHRKLNSANNNPDVTSGIQMEFYKLDPSESVSQSTSEDKRRMPEMTPIGSNMCKNNLVDFVVDEDSPYGIKLINNGPSDVYPHLFYFDNSDLSIEEYYQPPCSGLCGLDAPLKANGGTLTIGYGSGSSSPFSYFLRDDQNIDIGFLKLFVSAKPIDLSHIPQASPFEKYRGGIDLPKKVEEALGTIVLPVIQRRYSHGPESHSVRCDFQTLEIEETNFINVLEVENNVLQQELYALPWTATSEKCRLEEELSSLRDRLDHLPMHNWKLPGHLNSCNRGATTRM